MFLVYLSICSSCFLLSTLSLQMGNRQQSNTPFNKKYSISRPIQSYRNYPSMLKDPRFRKKYPLSKGYYENQLKRLNSSNNTISNMEILGAGDKKIMSGNDDNDYDEDFQLFEKLLNNTQNNDNTTQPNEPPPGGIRIIIGPGVSGFAENNDNDDDDFRIGNPFQRSWGNRGGQGNSRSQNFEVIKDYPISFKDVGGFEPIKAELNQCVDFLTNYKKYTKYNVRTPKGLIFEGPPGTGKTLLAKAMAGECKSSFIAVSGSEFQEKYVGVGSQRIRELFQLARDNKPCIIFIDEIDACGRKRSGDGESSTSERDNTLNELLISLDGFKNSSGIFLIGATNRPDLLDPALVRPGRIDKRIFVGMPDAETREAIINIHKKGKPHDQSVILTDLVDITMGLSGAQIENLLNEAMLNALRYNKTSMSMSDIDNIMNRMMAGWQPTEHDFSADLIDQIAIHEMGHAVAGLLAKHHAKMTKVIINLSSPQTPAYTVFEGSTTNIHTREALFEHLIILLAGRMAEEMFYTTSVTTGAINDFEEAFKLAEKMIVYYGMGKQLIYPQLSEKYKEMIDTEVATLISDAYTASFNMLNKCKPLMRECAELLKKDKLLKRETIIELINKKYSRDFNYERFEN